MGARLENGWLIVPGTRQATALVEVRVGNGEWQAAYHENGEALIRYDGAPPISWATRINGHHAESGTIGRPS